jgi:hypothetical protein
LLLRKSSVAATHTNAAASSAFTRVAGRP